MKAHSITHQHQSESERLRQKMIAAQADVEQAKKAYEAAQENARTARLDYYHHVEVEDLNAQREQQERQAAIERVHQAQIEAKRAELKEVLGPSTYY